MQELLIDKDMTQTVVSTFLDTHLQGLDSNNINNFLLPMNTLAKVASAYDTKKTKTGKEDCNLIPPTSIKGTIISFADSSKCSDIEANIVFLGRGGEKDINFNKGNME